MKKVLSVAVAFVMCAITLCAQTADEIVKRMDAEMEKHRNEGLVMTMDMKILLVGEISTTIMSLGDNYCARSEGAGVITWGDGKTTWTYNSDKNELTIENASKDSSVESGADDMLSGITSGYNVSLQSETDKAWYLKCKKSRSNKEKHAPKKMDLIVEKGTYLPVSMTAKSAIVNIAIHDVSYGVTEEQVTYNPSAYPNAKVIDKRK